MVTTNGSIFLWSVKPARIIQPLAPFFTEIDENKEYKEREDEFEEEVTEEDEDPSFKLLDDEKKMQRKLAKVNIDIYEEDKFHLCNDTQKLCIYSPELRTLEHLFTSEFPNPDYQFPGYLSYLPTFASTEDTYGLLAKQNIDSFKNKFDKVIN